jgi:hypothetical protein
LSADKSSPETTHKQAEALLRTVTGIENAHIVAHPAGGIAVVRVQCNNESSRGQVVRNIRSALFAGFGIAVSNECIDFIEGQDGQTSTPELVVVAAKEASIAKPTSPERGPSEKRPSVNAASFPQQDFGKPVRGFRVAAGKKSAAPAAQLEQSEESAVATMSNAIRIPRIMHAVAEEESATAAEAAVPANGVGVTVRAIVAGAAALKLESVEMRRQSGRLRCRVVISLGSDHFGAVADSTDPNAGEIHLAGRVACDALRAGGFTEARFDGAAVAQINGRQHVVVALSEWMGGETMVLSGAAPLEELPERAAAVAAIKAVLAQDIN